MCLKDSDESGCESGLLILSCLMQETSKVGILTTIVKVLILFVIYIFLGGGVGMGFTLTCWSEPVCLKQSGHTIFLILDL